MEMNEVFQTLVQFPRYFYAGRSRSFIDVYNDTKYFELHESITVPRLYEALKQDPKCVEEWALRSGDKRTTTGWYFNIEADASEIGFWDGHGIVKKQRFDDRFEACAEFIKKELEDVRNWYKPPPSLECRGTV